MDHLSFCDWSGLAPGNRIINTFRTGKPDWSPFSAFEQEWEEVYRVGQEIPGDQQHEIFRIVGRECYRHSKASLRGEFWRMVATCFS